MEVVRQTTVGYSDLDLTTTQGARTLLERIESASEAVCGDEQPNADPAELRVIRGCRLAAVSQAVRRVRNPLLASLAQQRCRTLFAAR
jgi:UrcA family protein